MFHTKHLHSFYAEEITFFYILIHVGFRGPLWKSVLALFACYKLVPLAQIGAFLVPTLVDLQSFLCQAVSVLPAHSAQEFILQGFCTFLEESSRQRSWCCVVRGGARYQEHQGIKHWPKAGWVRRQSADNPVSPVEIKCICIFKQ